MVLFSITGPSIEHHYPSRTNYVVICSIPKIIIVRMMLCYSNLILIISVFIDPNNFPQLLLQMFCGMYTNRTYGFDHPSGLRKFVAKVPSECSYLPSFIDNL